MLGRLQNAPEEVWIFGFGSIIYKQGERLRQTVAKEVLRREQADLQALSINVG